MTAEFTPETGAYLDEQIINSHKTGRIEYKGFVKIRRMMVSPCIEAVIFVKEPKGYSLALARRRPDDEIWPGQIGLPGVQVTEKDQDETNWIYFNDPLLKWQKELERLKVTELDVPIKWTFIGEIRVSDRTRNYGEMGITFATVLDSRLIKRDDIEYHPLGQRPEGIIGHHVPLIAAAAVVKQIYRPPYWWHKPQK